MTKRKKYIVIDSSNNEVECYTVRKAAKMLDMTLPELKLYMFKQGRLPYYRLMGKAKKRKIIRITGKDIRYFEEEYKKTRDFFGGIADRIKQGMAEMPITRFDMRQYELAKDCKLSSVMMNRILRKKDRVGIKTLERIAKALGKKVEWFLIDK